MKASLALNEPISESVDDQNQPWEDEAKT